MMTECSNTTSAIHVTSFHLNAAADPPEISSDMQLSSTQIIVSLADLQLCSGILLDDCSTCESLFIVISIMGIIIKIYIYMEGKQHLHLTFLYTSNTLHNCKKKSHRLKCHMPNKRLKSKLPQNDHYEFDFSMITLKVPLPLCSIFFTS